MKNVLILAIILIVGNCLFHNSAWAQAVNDSTKKETKSEKTEKGVVLLEEEELEEREVKLLDPKVLKARTAYFHHGSWKSMKKRAKKENKVAIVDFVTTWCRVCKEMEHELFADLEVSKFIKNSFIAYKLDGEKQKDISKKYSIKTYPTILFVDDEGNELHRITGYYGKEAFMDVLKKYQVQIPHTLYSEFR